MQKSFAAASISLCLVLFAEISLAENIKKQEIEDVEVKGYFREDGAFVKPHYRSSPDADPYDNYSFPGNKNPYTEEVSGGNKEAYLKRYYQEQTQ